MKRIYFYGGQQNEEWFKVKLGKFSSSEIHRLFGVVSKKERIEEVAKQIHAGTLNINTDKVDLSFIDNDYMNAVWKVLFPHLKVSSKECKAAKGNLKAVISGDDVLNNEGGFLCRAILGVEQIDLLPKSAYTYCEELAIDLFYEKQEISKGGPATDWGNEYEYLASRTFAENVLYVRDNPKIGFCELQGLETGCSPDDTEEKVSPSEYKCPHSRKIHKRHTLIKNDLDLLSYDKQKYFQVHHQIWVLGAKNGYWTSFDPRLAKNPRTAHKACHTIKIERNEDLCNMFEKTIKKAVKIRDAFLAEMREGENVNAKVVKSIDFDDIANEVANESLTK